MWLSWLSREGCPTSLHDRQKLNEWTWGFNGVPFLYSDNTTVGLNPNQNVTFVGVRYVYRWQ